MATAHFFHPKLGAEQAIPASELADVVPALAAAVVELLPILIAVRLAVAAVALLILTAATSAVANALLKAFWLAFA
ncbi:hypothetical protein ABVK25_001676 [Lepraria finkii]|uniref:Uncharacterized protein n=1 Tax=Lepraria finkii TaxID=1340010 RepID=A0ABR4BPV3_9LECA